MMSKGVSTQGDSFRKGLTTRWPIWSTAQEEVERVGGGLVYAWSIWRKKAGTLEATQ